MISGHRERSKLQSSFSKPHSGIHSLIRLARPVHWVKNGFVLAPALFTIGTEGGREFASAGLAFLGFCFVASSCYIVNDINDVEYDRLHPGKDIRPLALGLVSIRHAILFALFCVAAAILISLFLPWRVGILYAGYIVLGLLYTFKLKDLVLIDVMAIATGFMIRVFAGAAAINVTVSPWMILTTFFLSLFLAFSKRRSEIVAAPVERQRKVLQDYSERFLNMMLAITLSLTIVTYSIYVIQPAVMERTRGDGLLYTVPVVVYALLRYLFVIVKTNRGGDVADVVAGDAGLIASIFMWAIAVAILVATHP